MSDNKVIDNQYKPNLQQPNALWLLIILRLIIENRNEDTWFKNKVNNLNSLKDMSVYHFNFSVNNMLRDEILLSDNNISLSRL